MLSLKGYFILALCMLCFQVNAENIETPFVLNANKVPVLGGTLNIFGLNFGEDPSLIRVYIIDTETGRTIPCIDVDIVLSNAIISCDVVDIGTGKEKRIEVNVNGKSNAFTEDTNTLFSRFEPTMSELAFSKENSAIHITGANFGLDSNLVSVLIDGYEHTVVAVNDSKIICAKHADYVVPDSSDAASSVSVVVDGLHNVANLTFVDIVEQPLVDPTGKSIGGLGGIEEPSGGDIDNTTDKSTRKLIIYVFAIVSGGVGVALIVVGFLLVRKRKLAQLNAQLDKIAAQQKEQPQGAAIIMERADSMEEVDLNNNNTLISPRNSGSFYEPSTRDETDDDGDDSSSSSSFSSPYSSTNASPFASPFASSPENSRRGDDRSPATLGRSHSHSKKSKIDYDNVHTPNSRLSKRSLDSPYFTKQSAFDSPLHTSAELSAVNTPNSLQSSQELVQQHPPGTSVFDSPSVLHTAIARAAMLRGQPTESQQQLQEQQQQQQLQQQISQQQRRASLGAFQQHPFGRRRSSLGISSLHVSALHSSFGMQKQQIMQQQQQQQQQQQPQQQQKRPLSMSQGIEKPIAE